MKPCRYYRQRRNTVMVRAPKRFLDQVLWPEFSELDQALQTYLHQVTLRVIRDEVFADARRGAGDSGGATTELMDAVRPEG
jgi:tRNA nucleotidyltransferase (CCA-adding enzyme)